MKRKPPRDPGDGPYEIGYCKPPKHTQFKPGQSGNSKGRPRGQRNFRTAVRDALREKVTIREGDRTRSVSRMDAIIRVTFNNALRSDAKALVAFLQFVRSAGLTALFDISVRNARSGRPVDRGQRTGVSVN